MSQERVWNPGQTLTQQVFIEHLLRSRPCSPQLTFKWRERDHEGVPSSRGKRCEENGPAGRVSAKGGTSLAAVVA